MPNSGAIAPFSTTADLLLGGTATTSADFAFTGVDSTNPTASISAFTNSGNKNGISLSSTNATIQSLNRNTLTLGGNTTGDIVFQPGGISTGLYLGSNGNVGIGLNSFAPVNNRLYISATNTAPLAIDSTSGSNQSLIQIYNQGTTQGYIGYNSAGTGGIGILNATGTSMNFLVTNNGSIGVGTTTPLATLDVRGNSATSPIASLSGATTFANTIIDQSGLGDIFTASKSGATKFVINNAGNVGIGKALPTRPLDIAVNNSNTTNLPLLIEQAGASGDTGLELASEATSYYVGVNAANSNTFSINSAIGAGSSSILGQNYSTTQPDRSDSNTNEAQATQFVAASTGSISSLNVAFDTRVNGSSTFSVAIYDDNSGAPGNLLAKHTGTATVTTTNPGSINWNTPSL